MKINLPYGRSGFLVTDIPDKNLSRVLSPPKTVPIRDEAGAIRAALQNPLGTVPLRELAFPGARVSIAISDASRPNVERKVLPLLTAELEAAGVALRNITILIGTGSHRAPTENEISEKIPPGLRGQVTIVSHNASQGPFSRLGFTTAGYPVEINKLFVKADLRIAIGTVLPHPIAGYSGGGKAVAVGLSSRRCISSIHTPKAVDDPGTGLGKTADNPFLLYMYEAARMAGVHFLINCVADEAGNLLAVACGEVEATHRALIRTARSVFEVPFHDQADVVVVSVGYPKDGNLYHVCAEGICVVAGSALPVACVREGGTIVVVSPMGEGIYNEAMYRYLSASEPAEVVRKALSMNVDEPGIHRAYAVARIMLDHEIVCAQSELDPEVTRGVHMRPEPTVESALRYCLEKHGSDARFMVVSNSHRLVPVFRPATADLRQEVGGRD